MATLGRACLILALGVALYGIAASLYGARTGRREWALSGRRCVYALAGILTVSFVVLEAAFLRTDLRFEVVASHSSATTPTFYRLGALWSSQEGSLLLWVWLLSLWSSLILVVTRRRARQIAPYAAAMLLLLSAFFCGLTVFLADPFAAASPVPAEGAGLNPLLRHPSMMIHPPLLYSGYTLFTVPFAFAVGALVARRLDAEWIALTRRFALAAWACLGVGILLGARWSYVELGWGGYWGWDPVENASLMPWLTGTAFLHSVMIQEKRGMLKVWNVSLVLATGILALTGTFLVRSGILESIHAFGASTLGRPFLVLIAALVVGSIVLVASRRRELRSEHRLDSLVSREAVFLLNNLVLIGLCFVVLWGTFFPLISEAVTGTRASVGPPWFDRYTVPLALALVFLSGVGPLIAWRAASPRSLARSFALPVGTAAITFAALVAGGVASRPLALVMFCCAAFVAAAVGQELWRGTQARRAVSGEAAPAALVSLVRRNRRRYGGYVVHLGMSLLFVGVAASSAFQDSRDVRLAPGQSARVGGYDVRFVRATSAVDAEKVSLGAVLEVRREGKRVAVLRPNRGYYPSRGMGGGGQVERFFDGQATSEVGLQAGLRRDLWAAIEPDLARLQPFIRDADRRFPDASPQLQGFLIAALADRWARDAAPSTFRLIASPLVAWIWVGAVFVMAGALIALWPAPRAARARLRSLAAGRLARQPGRA